MRAHVAALALVVAACASQPEPYCPVAGGGPHTLASASSPLSFTSARFAQPGFWAKYTLVSGSGACAERPGEEVGLSRFEVPGNPTPTLGLQPMTPAYLVGNAAGAADWADVDPFNDVGGPRPEPVRRTLVNAAAKLYSTATLGPDEASRAVCAAGPFTPIDVTLREAVLPLQRGGGASPRGQVSAGTVTFPELRLRYEWTGLKVVSGASLAGSLFTAQLRLTEDTCTATYDVVGIWPLTLCHTDLDCSPFPVDEDTPERELGIPARRSEGSGLNPAFASRAAPLSCNNSAPVHAYTASYAAPPRRATEPRRITDAEGNPVHGVEQWGICELSRAATDFTGQ